jgi:hypothetical protein
VLAHRINGMIRTGEIRDWAEAARLLGITRARMTQIANLMLLAPTLQEDIAFGRHTFTERHFRSLTTLLEWTSQIQTKRSCVPPG